MSPLVLVFVVLVVGVGFNYQRNLKAEAREFRPYRAYAEADLDALIAAYEQAAKSSGRSYDARVERRSDAHEKGYFMGNVEEFERVQAAGRRTREAREEFAGARASLDELKQERARRPGERSKLRVFLRRAFTF